MGPCQRVSLLEIDPDLGERLDARSRELARRCAVARLAHVACGSWRPADVPGSEAAIGLLVVDGLLLHRVAIAGRQTAELLGPGDVLRATEAAEGFEAVPLSSRWQVCEQARVAVLDHRVAAVAGRVPGLLDAIVERALRRSERLAAQLAVAGFPRVDERLLIILWQLAERWGRVGPDGVRLPLPVTHETLGLLASARRPSVTTALGRLGRLGIVRRARGGWLLVGDAREQLARLEHDGDELEIPEPALGAASRRRAGGAQEQRRVRRAAHGRVVLPQ